MKDDVPVPDAPGRRHRTLLIGVAKLTLGTLLVAWLVSRGHLQLAYFRWTFLREHWVALVGLFALQVTSLSLIIGRWAMLLRVQGIHVPVGSVFVVSSRGLFAGLFMPGTFGLDGARMLYLRRWAPAAFTEGLASMIVDRVLGFVGLLLLAAVSGAVYMTGVLQSTAAVTLSAVALAAAILSCLLLASLCGFGPALGLSTLRRYRYLARWANAFAGFGRDPRVLVGAVGLSALAHLLTCVAAGLCLATFGEAFSWAAVLAMTPIVIFVRFLPLVPLGLGISDAAAELLYRTADLAGGAEAQMLSRAMIVLVFLLAGLAFLASPVPSPASPEHRRAAP